MAKPIYYPDWATTTVTLPGTSNTNKIRPKETIRVVGVDYGQIMTCEEMNWILNNIGLWVRYLVDDFIPTLPNTYLPLVGTKITMAGDATGSVTWNGSADVTLSIQVVDNSHNHLSSNITDATSTTATANVLVKRDGSGSIYGGDIYVCGTATTDPATVFFKNFAGQTVGNMSSEYNSGGQLYIYRMNPSTGGTTAAIRLYDAGYVLIDNPRTNSGQDTSNGNALVRLDYLNSRLSSLQNTLQTNINSVQNNLNSVNSNLNSRIDSVQNSLQSQINSLQSQVNARVTAVRINGRIQLGVSESPYYAGHVMTGWAYGDKKELRGASYWSGPLQYYVNGGWVTISY